MSRLKRFSTRPEGLVSKKRDRRADHGAEHLIVQAAAADQRHVYEQHPRHEREHDEQPDRRRVEAEVAAVVLVARRAVDPPREHNVRRHIERLRDEEEGEGHRAQRGAAVREIRHVRPPRHLTDAAVLRHRGVLLRRVRRRLPRRARPL